MNLHFPKDWLKKFDDLDEPEGCPHCGAIAGACNDYPNCPGGSPSRPDNLSIGSPLSDAAAALRLAEPPANDTDEFAYGAAFGEARGQREPGKGGGT